VVSLLLLLLLLLRPGTLAPTGRVGNAIELRVGRFLT
jgi:hypothetical protein